MQTCKSSKRLVIHKLRFDDQGKATCPESGDEYELKAGVVNKISSK